MTQRISSRVSIIVATTIFIFGFSICSYNIDESYINAQSSAFDNKTLFVTGSASTQTKPDKVTMSLGVETTNTKAKAALVANSELMDKIVNALKIAGIKENETSTSSFTITPNRDYSIDKNQGKLIGFTVRNSILINSQNVNNASDWIDISVSSGANNVDSIYFSISDKKLDEIKKELIKQAIGNAREKADVAASELGLKVVGVRTINIDQATPIFTGPTSYALESFKNEPSAASPPILTGDQQISLNVNIVFLMGE
ncbi:MAG: SIMPL domain-containing protein [Nitrososphaeraceae archaeon]